MIQFTSKREKRLWIWVLLIIVAIYALIFIGRPLSGYLRDHGILSIAFWIAIYLTLATVLWYGWNRGFGGREIGIWLGVAAVYLLMFLRMASPEERSHLIEYSVLALFIHEALRERARHDHGIRKTALLALVSTIAIGILDECIQLLVPGRVFDPVDILFNTLAAIIAIAGSSAVRWVRNPSKKKTD